MRRILQLEVAGHRLVGTLHEPVGPPAGDRVGVMLVSFGQQPRAWVGDLGVRAGDVLAAAGYPVFRFDMPGTGDSPGDLPVHVEEFWRFIQDGGHEAIAKALIRELQRRFGLRGLVVGGFCGGAITAVHAADVTDAEVLGLVLLEPEVGLTPVSRAERPRTTGRIEDVSGFVERVDAVKRRLRSPRSWLRLLSGKSDLSFWWGLVRYATGRAVRKGRGESLPPDANRKLLDGLARFAARRRPVLMVTVGSESRRRYYSSYGLAPGRSDEATGLTWLEVPNTTHALLSGGAKEVVPGLVAGWLARRFASTVSEPSPCRLGVGLGPAASDERRGGRPHALARSAQGRLASN